MFIWNNKNLLRSFVLPFNYIKLKPVTGKQAALIQVGDPFQECQLLDVLSPKTIET
jgi:hypothetical protein